MKKLSRFLFAALASFLLAFFITSYVKAFNEPQYIISDYNGKIAVYKYQEKIPQNIYDIYVSSFSLEEQRNIKDGIKIYSDNKLQEILEAYLS